MKTFLKKMFFVKQTFFGMQIFILGVKFHFKNKRGKINKALSFISSNIESNSKCALELLRKFIKKYGLNNVVYYLNVAVFAYNNGYKNEQVEKAVFIYNQIEENLKNKLFENYLKDKNVAVVGNCGCEIGTGHGKEIDSNDVVIRFNNFPSNYEEDYGKKCNVWFRGFGLEGDIENRDWNQFDFVVCPILAKKYLPEYLFEVFYQNIKKYPEKFSSLPVEFMENLYEQYGVGRPTNGFKSLIYIKDCCTVSNLSVYGFSFLEEFGKEDDAHFYDNGSTIQFHTTMDFERQVLRSLFKIDKARKNKEVTAIIVARKGSVRIPSKSMLKLCGQTLIERKIKQLKNCKNIDRVVFGSDSEEMLEIAKKAGAETVKRPEYYCDEKLASANEMIKNMMDLIKTDVVVWAHCTNPFISSTTYDYAVQTYFDNLENYDSLLSVVELKEHLWKDGKPFNYNPYAKRHIPAKELPPMYMQDGGIFIQSYENMKNNTYFFGEKPYLYNISKDEFLDINEYKDYLLAKAIVENEINISGNDKILETRVVVERERERNLSSGL